MKAIAQRRLRRLHSWLGLFFAPSILFFALSGTIQSLGFQDRAQGYEPPAWIKLAANVHKHGEARMPKRKARPAGAPPGPKEAATTRTPSAFSIFSATLGLLLASATILGIWIALVPRRGRGVATALLAAGIALPTLLLLA